MQLKQAIEEMKETAQAHAQENLKMEKKAQVQAAARARVLALAHAQPPAVLHPLGFCILQGPGLLPSGLHTRTGMFLNCTGRDKNGGARGGEKERCDIDGAGALIPKPDTGCTKFLQEGAVCQKDLAERSYQTKDVKAD